MQTSSARTASSFAGLTIVDATGNSTCRLPAPWHFSQPTFHSVTCLGLDVVVHRVAAVAQRTRRPLHLIGRIVLDPPVGSRLDVVAPPGLVPHVPLSGEDVVVVAPLGEVALLPLAAVGERDVLLAEGHERVRRREVADDGVRVLRGIAG